MTIIFQIDYAAQWGDELVVRSSLQQEPLAMRCLDGRRWEAALEVGAWPAALYYKYALRKADGELVYEAEAWRRLALEGTPYPAVALADSWRVAGERALIAAPYTSVLFRQKAKGEGKLNQHACKLTVAASCIPQGCVLCATGSAEALGRWDRQRPLLMQPNGEGGWHTGFTPAASQQPICYKYALYDLEQRRIVGYEQRADNRTLPAAGGAKAALWRDDGAPRFDLPLPRGAGVAIPVFALRSESGYGVGQFTDLKLLADWAKLAGLSMIQLLPVNDTSATATWADSYPYAGISVFALHPLYLDLAPLAACLTARQAEQLRREQAELNALREVDYEQAMRLKWKYARIAYAKEKSAVFASKEYQAFFAQRQEWLAPYAAFCYLRDQHGTADFAAWGDYATYSAAKVAALAAPRAAAHDELALHYYVQFLLHRQLQEATAYCRARGIVLKGDIPIGIARRSCDAWVAPHLYNMDAQAGAPPDAFSATGQNWGFPTYSWERMAADGYRWWQQRLRAMAEYFDAFRIDHVLGFFRIWEIPLGAVEGLLGCFSPALPLSVAELGQRGAWFDAERLCAPYLTPQVLRDALGEQAEEVAQRFMEEHRPGQLRFREPYRTQRGVEAALKEGETALKAQLFDLLSEVLLIEDRRAPAHYHPRIAMHSTRSYRALDEQQQRALDAIYVDFFYHRHNQFWKALALRKLPAVRYATGMMACGEDLGMVPSCVPEVMQALSLLSLIIQRMPSDSSAEFARLEEAPYLSVCSPGSHDTSGLREWWEEDREATQRFYRHVLRREGKAPAACEPWVAREIILQHLRAPSAWAVFPLQDLLATDAALRHPNPRAERINVPGNPHHYWRYRMHLTLEALLHRPAFAQSIRGMVAEAGRGAL